MEDGPGKARALQTKMQAMAEMKVSPNYRIYTLRETKECKLDADFYFSEFVEVPDFDVPMTLYLYTLACDRIKFTEGGLC
jgi:hypothetical protein